jgi:two-component system CheB/CheR fusion protein
MPDNGSKHKHKAQAKKDKPDKRNKLKRREKPRQASSRKATAQCSLVVGIGASAGGLDAFKTFLEQMPNDSGMAFVLVQHLAPNHESMLVDLLETHTHMPVCEAEEGKEVRAEHVYVIPPGASLTIKDGCLRVKRPRQADGARHLIDTFFSSLAEDQGERAVCVVLSGSGSDGTAGLKSIKQYGGFALAQAGLDDSVGSGMPSSAASTGLVDFCGPIEAMPEKLIEYARHLDEVAVHKSADGTRRDVTDHLDMTTAILHENLGHDFSQYKQSTLGRRVQRRMQVLRMPAMDDYIERLRTDAHEQRLLFNDLLIGVTQFFRDTEAWQVLEKKALPQLLDHGSPDDPLRIWSVGCGAGDEVYSLSILFAEALEARNSDRTVQIFGTDIDENAIETARTGRYVKPPPGLSAERRKRFFTREEDGTWLPNKKIREMCVFAPHSVIKDPPFSRLDLISCRNLLIYMDTDLQDQVLKRLRYGLKPEGWLFLGSAEGISGHNDLFEVVDKKRRLFKRRETATRGAIDFAPPVKSEPASPETHPGQLHSRTGGSAAGERIERAARGVMEKHFMPYVVVDGNHRIVRFSSGPLHRFVVPAAGDASFDLFAMLKRPLRQAARVAVNKAFASGESVRRENVPLRIEARASAVTLIVEPFDTSGYEGGKARLGVVAFDEVKTTRATDGEQSEQGGRDESDLKHELKVTKAQLNTAIHDLETSNEEMRSANEEYQSVNEELQSTNEELETSKEEMQSVNEELQTVNTELSHKNEALTRTNSDLRNLLESTQIATLFLDTHLNVKGFTPSVRQLFHLRDGDHDRPLNEIVSRLDYNALLRDAEQVLRSLGLVEREIELIDGDRETFIMRVRPYRTIEDVIDGVVITFTDITARKQGEQALKQSEERLRALVTATSDVVYRMSPDWEEMYHLDSKGFLANTRATSTRWVDEYIPAESRREVQNAINKAIQTKSVFELEHQVLQSDGVVGWTISRAIPLVDAHGDIIEWFGTATDITQRKRDEEHRDLLMHELSHRVKNTLATVQSLMIQSRQGVEGVDEFTQRFGERIRALANTHTLLTLSHWRGADLAELARAELKPYMHDDHPQWSLHGEAVHLQPNETIALGMAFHELVTNAAKHGALSVAKGGIDIEWKFESDKDKILRLDWVERGGPTIKGEPRHRGFGLRLVDDGLSHELEADVKIAFEPKGIRYTVRFPLGTQAG